jgi:hypothetical protein
MMQPTVNTYIVLATMILDFKISIKYLCISNLLQLTMQFHVPLHVQSLQQDVYTVLLLHLHHCRNKYDFPYDEYENAPS